MNKTNTKSVQITKIAKLSCMLICILTCSFMASAARAQHSDGLKIAQGVLDVIGSAVNPGQHQNGRFQNGFQPMNQPHPGELINGFWVDQGQATYMYQNGLTLDSFGRMVPVQRQTQNRPPVNSNFSGYYSIDGRPLSMYELQFRPHRRVVNGRNVAMTDAEAQTIQQMRANRSRSGKMTITMKPGSLKDRGIPVRNEGTHKVPPRRIAVKKPRYKHRKLEERAGDYVKDRLNVAGQEVQKLEPALKGAKIIKDLFGGF